jgi:hypothetical protein
MKIMHATYTLLLLRTRCCLVVTARALRMYVDTAHYTACSIIDALPPFAIVLRCTPALSSAQASNVASAASFILSVHCVHALQYSIVLCDITAAVHCVLSLLLVMV